MEDLFNAAASHLQDILANAPNSVSESTLLYLYARYKQVTIGPCNTSKPSFIEISSRKKWISWNSLQNMDKSDAMKEYINKIKSIDESWNPKASAARAGMGITVSVLNHNTEKELNDADKDIFDWCKEGSLNEVVKHLPSIFPKDDEKRTLLHWACDRGHLNVATYLVNKGHEVNCKDCDSLTPLHYAVSCDHFDIVSLLLENNADVNIRDSDGETPIDCATSKQIKTLIDEYSFNKNKAV